MSLFNASFLRFFMNIALFKSMFLSTFNTQIFLYIDQISLEHIGAYQQ